MKHKKHKPKFRLKGNGENAALSLGIEDRVPLMLTHIQELLLHALLGNSIIYEPSRWYVLEKGSKVSSIACLVIEGISLQHWINNEEYFKSSRSIFTDVVEIVTPSIYKGSLIEELAAVPLSNAEKEGLIKKYGNMNLALESRKDLMVMIKAVFPIETEASDCGDYSELDKYPRTKLILSAQQLIEENYPLPLKGKLQHIYSDYVMTKSLYQPVTPNSPMFGLDCEMCMTNAGSELTRVSVVNENHETIYESLVKPYNDITDYLTQYSGVSESTLQNITKRLEDVQNDLRDLLPPDAILIGQSLNTDLHALKMMHPYVIDTSLIFNITGERNRKPKLKTLAREFLNENIQQGRQGHCSVEDSLTSLKLVQLKLSKSLEFGDAVQSKRKLCFLKNNTQNPEEPQYASTIFNHLIEQKKKSLIVGCDDITGDYHSYLSRANEFTNTQSLLKKGKPKKVKLSTVDDQDEVIDTLSSSINVYDFVMGHLKLNISDNKIQIEKVDKWISKIWDTLGPASFLVIIFAGTNSENGIAMFKIKNTL